MKEFNAATKEQIIQIQSIGIIKFLGNAIKYGDVSHDTTNKIQMMYNILHGNPISYGVNLEHVLDESK